MRRDPIEEEGGNNLYGFVNNSPNNNFDILGLDPKYLYDLNGTRAHDLFKRWIKYERYPGEPYYCMQELRTIFPGQGFSQLRPDVLNTDLKMVWELKTVNHMIDGEGVDQLKQLYLKELNEKGKCYRPGDPKILAPIWEMEIGTIRDYYTHKKLTMTIFPGNQPGMVYYDLNDEDIIEEIFKLLPDISSDDLPDIPWWLYILLFPIISQSPIAS